MLLTNTDRGLYCPAADFYIDPIRPVDFAVITHAHSDHARSGSKHYLTAGEGRLILQHRIGEAAKIQSLPFGERLVRDGVAVSFHPAGHVLGSGQVRLEYRGEVWVVSGDYKTENDGISGAFAPIRCHTFVTESTFALPIYHWEPQVEIFREINDWWRENQAKDRTSVLFAYSLGKSQRVLAWLDPAIGPVCLHGAVAKCVTAYENSGVTFPQFEFLDSSMVKSASRKPLVIAPGSTDNSPWLRKFGDASSAFVSGWMQVRGQRRRRALDRGFALSDHADWDGLLASIEATGAERIWATHGFTETLVCWLREKGKEAESIGSHWSRAKEEDFGNAVEAKAGALLA